MNSEHRATPWVEVALITLSASEKAIGYGNTTNSVQTLFPDSYPDKPVLGGAPAPVVQRASRATTEVYTMCTYG